MNPSARVFERLLAGAGPFATRKIKDLVIDAVASPTLSFFSFSLSLSLQIIALYIQKASLEKEKKNECKYFAGFLLSPEVNDTVRSNL